MPKATWRGALIAESDETIRLEGNHYFPRDAVVAEHLIENPKTTTCPWKGIASYFDVVVDGERNEAAAWTYPEPSEAAAGIKDHIAFWRGVTVTD